jgi:predicted transcriptional regulator of viral defense system
MIAKITKTARLLDLMQKHPILRVRDVKIAGIHPEHLRRLLQKGIIVRASRGIYRRTNGNYTQHLSLAEVAKRVPRGVICLLSALLFHGIGTQLPPDLWLAVDRRSARPSSMNPRLRVVRLSGASFDAGIENTKIDGVTVRIYCLAKTVVDCFKFRHKVGLDVALEALRDGWRSRKVTMKDLIHFSQVCRVEKVMRPYLESLA